jgi:transketolase
MIVLSPCDYFEARKATVVAAKIKGPVYIRLAREKSPVITSEHASFEIGKAQLLFSSDKKAEVGIVATGDVVYQALVAAKNLSEKGIGVKVLNLSTIKPIDEKALVSLAEETGAIITVEDHQVAGGMGSAVAECLVKNYPVPMEFIGVQDEFGQSGTSSELIEHYGLDAGSIEHEANKILSRKKVELTSLKKLAKIS